MRDGRLARLAPASAGLVAGVLALGPALGPGFVLRYDMVFVPDPPVAWPAGGFPRAVPSDLVVALLAQVIPACVVQKLILLGIFVLAASGAAALVPGERLVPRLVAAVFYVWNAYLAQRLLLGQWALLLGFAGLPWVVRAAARGGARRLAVALVPAAVGGFQAMLISALTVLGVVAVRRAPGRVRAVLGPVAIVAVLSLPWAVPGVLSRAVTDPAGVDAFAARADGPFGTLGSLVSLGGVWNAEAAVPGQGAWWLATARLLLAVLAVVAFAWPSLIASLPPEPAVPQAAAVSRTPPRPAVPCYRRGLLMAAVAGTAVALLGAHAPGVLKAVIGFWPGFGPLRDGQLYVAPLALVQALGLGVVAERFARRDPGGHLASVVVPGAVAVLVPVLVLPAFAWGASGRLASVEYPAEWARVRAIVDADPRPGALLSLPWGAHRAFAWNGGRVVLDPATKMFTRRVVWDDALVVGMGGGRTLRVAGEDPAARRAGRVLGTRRGPLTSALAAMGVRYVLLATWNGAAGNGAVAGRDGFGGEGSGGGDAVRGGAGPDASGGVDMGQDENAFLSRLPGAVPVFAGRQLVLLRL